MARRLTLKENSVSVHQRQISIISVLFR